MKNSRKFFAVLLVYALVMVSGFSAFADSDIDTFPPVGIISTALNNIGYNARMNCSGESLNYNNRNVDLYHMIPGSSDQTWKVLPAENDRYYIASLTTDSGRNVYGLNIYRFSDNYGNCDVMKIRGNETDASIRYHLVSGNLFTYDSICGLEQYYYPGYYASVVRNGVGYYGCDVRWSNQGNPSNTSAMQWQLVHSGDYSNESENSLNNLLTEMYHLS